MKQSILETEIEKWAAEHGYPVMPRKFYAEIKAENEVSREIGVDEETMNLLRAIDGAAGRRRSPEEYEREKRELAYEQFGDMNRHVLTPTGILIYRTDFKDDVHSGMPDERSYEEHLERVSGLPKESIDFRHGFKRLKGWRSHKVTIKERREAGDAWFYLNLSRNCPHFRIDLFDRHWAVDKLTYEGPIPSLEFKVDIQRMYKQPLRRDSACYKQVFDIFSAHIDGTH